MQHDNIYTKQLTNLLGRYNNPEISSSFKNILSRTIDGLIGRCKDEGIELPEHIINYANDHVTLDNNVAELLNKSAANINVEANWKTDDLADALNFPFNEAQNRAITLARNRQSFVLTGPAGSGKTTTVKGVVATLITEHIVGQLSITDHKYLKSGSPNIALISFTNKAVNNLKKFLPKMLHGNCVTAHKLLEYEPTEEMVENEEGRMESRFAFKATRNQSRPLPDLEYLLIDEGTMMNVPLFNEIMEALPNKNLKLIIIGDINQLPPVFGKSIFVHAMQKGMTVVELTEVHRQALESPILALAHRILSGKPIPAPELTNGAWNIDKSAEGNGKLEIRCWKKRNPDTVMMAIAPKFFEHLINSGSFDPEKDTVICPFGKSFGVTIMNEAIASVHSKNINAPVYEIFAGITARYFRVGERVLYNKTEHIITKISDNPEYFGKTPREPSTTMNYNGVETDQSKLAGYNKEFSSEDFAKAEARMEAMMESFGGHVDEDNPRRRASSHIITLENLDTGEIVTARSAGDVSEMLLGYAVTVHRTQGSEYGRVVIIFHHSHATMLSRELLYVAVTRAKEDLLIYCENNSFITGITSQRIKGNTVDEKVKSFEAEYNRSLRNKKVPVSEIPIGLDRFLPVTQ